MKDIPAFPRPYHDDYLEDIDYLGRRHDLA
jgi:hypothetical protein